MINQPKRRWQRVLLLLIACLSITPILAHGDGVEPSFELHMSKVCLAQCIDPTEVVGYVKEAAKDLEIDPIDLLAIMQVESGFKPKAYNKGNVGLMQVNLRYHKSKFKSSPYNAQANIFVGASIYKACLIKRKYNKARALRCYNGENRKDMIYPNKVIKAMKELQLFAYLVKVS